MAIPQYIRPMAEVYQQRDITQAATGEHLAACIVGANYDVYRYGKEDLTPHTFETPGTFVLEYEKNPLLDYELDPSSVSLYAENIVAVLKEAAEYPADTTDAMVIRAGENKCFAKAPGTVSSDTLVIPNYNVQIGDKVLVKDEETTTPKPAYVTGLVGAKLAATTTQTTLAGSGSMTLSGEYIGKENTTYIVQISAGTEADTVTITVTDTAGVDMAIQMLVPTSAPLNNLALGTSGLSVTIAAAQLQAGNAWQVVCVAASASTTVFDGISLSVAPVDITKWTAAVKANETYNVSMQIFREYSGPFASNFGNTTAWELDANNPAGPTITILGDVNMRVGGNYYPLESGIGKLYASFRVRIIPDINEDIITIASDEDIEENFGTIALENDLAYACSCCLKGSAGRAFYAIRVRSTNTDGYMEAIKKTETNTAVYSFVALTDDMDTQIAIRDYNEELSAPDIKRWRRLLVGVDYPGAYTVATADANSIPLSATFTPYSTGGNYILQLSSTAEFDFTSVTYEGAPVTLQPGDFVRIAVSGAEYMIKSVLSATELLLVSGPSTPISDPVLISLIKAESAINNKEYVINRALTLNTYRCTLIWSDHGQAIVDGVYETISNKFIAAEIAGIASAVVPQKSITHTEVQSITKASRMYTQYTQNDLDNIAKNGVMIITQDMKNDPCYIRHQLTTQTEGGLMFYEESFTRNFDNISYAVAENINGFIGKANVVPSALTALRDRIINVLNGFTTNETDILVGPALVSYDGLQVYQDPVFLDRVIIKVNYYLPAPLNNIKCYQMAYVAVVTI